ncbi:sporulation protein YpjB [Ferdinandcohnia quinoae]|uniref:Sporulation protein YpjB n=1 Tax=Fredinandcohnia quinoae TaxID=2918902 RepID=A0AAW5E7G9_9BACI|nr:sporulation protein YpjB [Fredinandcohnia sp. SECRCQ15]MCH1624729.1 sporulation protein YpjB [Fredinandcohnia sp. SECRCQ15]
MRFFRMVVIICILLFLYSASIFAVSKEGNWESLDHISDQALLMVKQERYEEAEQFLSHFSNEFLKVNLKNRPYSMGELQIITDAHNHALEAVNSSSLDFGDKLRIVTQFRLVIDAIRSEHQPMWAEMEDSIMTTFSQMKQTVEIGDIQTYQQHLNAFLSKYEMIYPSLKVDITEEAVQRLDSHITFLDHYRDDDLNNSTRLKQLEQMEVDLTNLFDKMKEDDADPSLIWVMILTGSTIILSLTYVGWRKYIGDKQKKQSQRDYDDR